MKGGVDIWEAVKENDASAVERYADAGGDVNILDNDGSTPLWVALEQSRRKSYKALLENGADPNVVMSGKRVVTHWAAMRDDPWWLKLALQNGADPNLVNVGRGRPSEGPPLKAAISNGTLEHVSLLVQHGANINKADPFGCYPLADAAAQNKFNVVLYLLDQGADYEEAECSGITFLNDIRQKYNMKKQWYRLEVDRENLDAIRKRLQERGIDIAGE